MTENTSTYVYRKGLWRIEIGGVLLTLMVLLVLGTHVQALIDRRNAHTQTRTLLYGYVIEEDTTTTHTTPVLRQGKHH